MASSSSHFVSKIPMVNGGAYDDPSGYDDEDAPEQPEQQRKRLAYSAQLFKWTKQQWEQVRGDIARTTSNASTTSDPSSSDSTSSSSGADSSRTSSEEICPFRESALVKMPESVRTLTE